MYSGLFFQSVVLIELAQDVRIVEILTGTFWIARIKIPGVHVLRIRSKVFLERMIFRVFLEVVGRSTDCRMASTKQPGACGLSLDHSAT